MIPHLRGREDALEPFGWNPEDTAWVAMVCLNSGVFTRGQYSAFFRTHRVRAHRFVQSLVDLKLALEEPIPVISPQNRATACRITYKGIYRALEIPNVRHRRAGDPAVYLRRLLSLDYVIEHPQLEWLPTEDATVRVLHALRRASRPLCRIEFTAERPARLSGISPENCPSRAGRSAHSSMSIRATTPRPNCGIGARRTNTSGRYCGSADSRFTSPRSRSIPTPTSARETCWTSGRGIARASGPGVGGKRNCGRNTLRFPEPSSTPIPRLSNAMAAFTRLPGGTSN